MEPNECQLHSLQHIQLPLSRTEVLWQFRHRLKHMVRRRLRYLSIVARKLVRTRHVLSATATEKSALQPGDRVRVRSRDEVLDTLDGGGMLEGCGFMEEMSRFCGTQQTVLKQMRQFLDETDYRVKRVRGRTYLLEGVMCAGTANWGPCDRSCFYFWREEWLEPL